MVAKKRTLKHLLFPIFFFVLGIGIMGGLVLMIVVIRMPVPDLTNFSERKIAQSTKIYDRTGEILLYDIHGEEKRTLISFEDIPRSIKNATIAIEDDTFYQHHGFRPFAFLRAIFTNLLHGSFEQGGSTITQQLVKNTLLTQEKTISRKFKEIILALKIERQHTKDEILNLYLNQIPYGNNAYGIEAAAQTFFNKSAAALTLRESTYLAALPKAPSYYSPCGKHRDELEARALFTLERMEKLEFISHEEFEQAKKEQVSFSTSCFQDIIAPHFVIEVRDELNKQFGEDTVERLGLRVITTLDATLQKNVEEIVQKFSETIKKNFNANNVSIVALDPRNGDILAMMGSKNYFGTPDPEGCRPGIDCAFDSQVNVALRKRQPGSAFKPFVYATALKKGFTPETVLFDLPTEFSPLCNPDGSRPPNIPEDTCYHPLNYDNKFRGPVTLREALAQSLNIPSVKLLYLAGIRESMRTAEDFGITSLEDPDRFGLTLVLGGGEVSPLELASAYSVFANDGVKNHYRDILKIEDANKKPIFEAQLSSTEVIEPNIARAINAILSDNEARAPAFTEDSALYVPGRDVAAKTGTTNDYRDAWIMGYTPSIVIGAWAGNNDNTPMKKKVAGFIIAPIWKEIMQSYLLRAPEEYFQKPEPFPASKPVLRGEWRGGKEFIIDTISKKLATDFTPQEFQEKKVVQEVHSILYWLSKDDPQGAAPENPLSDSQFRNWEQGVRAWAQKQGFIDKNDSVIPKEYDTIHTTQNIPRVLRITIMPQKDSYKISDTISLQPVIESALGINQVDYFVEQEYKGSVKKFPFLFSLNLADFNLISSFVLKIKVYDTAGNTSEYTTNIPITP